MALGFLLDLSTDSKRKWSGARFSKVPKLFGHISGDIILFVSLQRRRLKARNFVVILILFPLQHVKRPALQNKRVGVLRMAFRARNVLGTFEKRASGRFEILFIISRWASAGFFSRRTADYSFPPR